MGVLNVEGSSSVIGKDFQSIGPYNKKEVIEVHLILRSKDPEGFEKKFEELQSHNKHMNCDEITEQFGPAARDIKRIKKIAGLFRIKWWFHFDIDIDHSNWCVILRGTVKRFNKLFGIQIMSYKHPAFPHREFRAFTGDISLPKKWNGIVIGVFGLDNLPIIMRKPFKKCELPHPGGPPPPGAPPPGGPPPRPIVYTDFPIPFFKPNELAEKYYNFPKDFHGKGQSIAIIICTQLDGNTYEYWAGYRPEELKHYFEEVIGVPAPTIKDVEVDGIKNNPGVFCGDLEVYTDIEIIGSIAYEADITVFFTNNQPEGLKKALTEIKDSGNYSVVSISYAVAELQWSEIKQKGLIQLLRGLSLMGTTICVSSGDHGTLDGATIPASYKHVLACGGTMFRFKGNEPGIENIMAEIVWNEKVKFFGKDICKESRCKFSKNVDSCPYKDLLGDYFQLASCGGESRKVHRPMFQEKIKPEPYTDPDNQRWLPVWSRKTPDVAGYAGFNAGYKCYLYGKERGGGGTSSAAPLYAALIALINEALDKAGKERVGLVTRILYNMDEEWRKKVFNNIIEGDNDLYDLGFYYAGPGWDFCTGWGSINGQALLDYLLEHQPDKESK